jgi:tellurium resistance protein TerD
MAVKLSKGSKINISKDTDFLSKLKVVLRWDTPENSATGNYDLDAECFGLVAGNNESGFELFDEDYFVFYRNPTTPNNSIVHSGDDKTGADGEEIDIDLALIPQAITHISFFVTIHRAFKKLQTFGQIKSSLIQIIDIVNDVVLMEYKLNEKFGDETAVHFGTLYRNGKEWDFQAIGQGYRKELADILYSYGVEVED